MSFELSRGSGFYLEVSGKFTYNNGIFENEHLEIHLNLGLQDGIVHPTLMIHYKNTGATSGNYNKIYHELSHREYAYVKESLLKMIPAEQRAAVSSQLGGGSKKKTSKKKTSKKKTSKKKQVKENK
jgi:hypothetical protein